MEITIFQENNVAIARVKSSEVLVSDVQSALDLIATVRYESQCDRIVLGKEAFHEDFFSLKTRLAGEILQKMINYQMKIAIVGDFTAYMTKNFSDFIYECNKGKDIFFLSDEREGITRLSQIVG